jgi:hypothetical protein
MGWLSTAVMTGRTDVSERALGRGLAAPGNAKKLSKFCEWELGGAMEEELLEGNCKPGWP